MNTLKSLISLIIKPLKEYFHIFFTILILHSIVDISYFYVWKAHALGVLCYGLVISYLLTVPCIWLNKNKRLFSIYKYTIFTIYGISFSVDIISHAVLGSSLDINVVSAILATNKNEALECIQTYFSIIPIIVGGVLLAAIYFCYKLLQKYKIRSQFFYLLWILGILSGFLISTFSSRINLVGRFAHVGGPFGKIYLFYDCSEPINLQENLIHPKITVDKTNQPQNIVMIIGESLTKHHCSTYGYEKETCPLLEKLENDSTLYKFSNVKSPRDYTLPVFKELFYQYREQNHDSIEWYQSPCLIDIISRSNYNTFWISNQSKKGLLDNVIGQLSDLCTENHFVQIAGNHITYDESVIKFIQPILNTASNNNFFVIHLIGSHTMFDQRYPEGRNKFGQEDYLDKPDNQRQILAEYDNSVLYNDSVVNQIFNVFHDKEAIVFYYPDHAVDLFQSSPTYYGHANSSQESIKWGKEIPFYIYVTSKYKQKFAERINSINKNINQPFCTDNMFYTIMDLIGASFPNNDIVQDSTLFRK